MAENKCRPHEITQYERYSEDMRQFNKELSSAPTIFIAITSGILLISNSIEDKTVKGILYIAGILFLLSFSMGITRHNYARVKRYRLLRDIEVDWMKQGLITRTNEKTSVFIENEYGRKKWRRSNPVYYLSKVSFYYWVQIPIVSVMIGFICLLLSL